MCHFEALCAEMAVLKWLEGYHPLVSCESACIVAAVTHDSTPALNPTLVLSSAGTQQLFESMCESETVCVICVQSSMMLKRKSCFSAFWGGSMETMGTLCGELAKRRRGGGVGGVRWRGEEATGEESRGKEI